MSVLGRRLRVSINPALIDKNEANDDSLFKSGWQTEEVGRTIKADRGSVLLIGHRISLIRQSCQRLGLDCYLDFEGGIQSERVGICLDSLKRLRSRGTGPKRYRTVIIDESEQVLSHFFSDTIDAATREAIFVDFTSLLQRADRVVALDADLGWLTFETLSKLSQVAGDGVIRESHVFVNDRPDGATLHMYDSYHHLVGELMASLADGKRIFVTSNSLGLINKLSEAINHQFGAKAPTIAITSETKDRKDVKAFVMNPSELALQYRAILSSPSLGTGVDITFPEQEQSIDVVFGFFESNVNTHFDLDQQLARVRHPRAVRVWVNPRQFHFETAVDVVKHDIQVNGLYKNVLLGYDADAKPIYHTDDPLIDMAALAVSQQRASKNNLRGNFIDLKRHQGLRVEFIASEPLDPAPDSQMREPHDHRPNFHSVTPGCTVLAELNDRPARRMITRLLIRCASRGQIKHLLLGRVSRKQAVVAILRPCGSKAPLRASCYYFRSSPGSRHRSMLTPCLKSSTSGLMRHNKIGAVLHCLVRRATY
jgi:hypothetical protein